MAFSDTIAEMYLDQMRANYGSAELMVRAGEDSPSHFFRPHRARQFSEELDYVAGNLRTQAEYRPEQGEQIDVKLTGFDWSELQQMNPVQTIEEKELLPFTGRKLVISQQTAREYDLEVGASLELALAGSRQQFIIAGIAKPEGIFSPRPGSGFTGLLPLGTLAGLTGNRGLVSRIYVKSAPGVSLEDLQDKLAAEYNRFVVEETITKAEVEEMLGNITVPFFFILILVVFISIFIIYTSFKVITTERLPVIGTFRSIGATQRATDLILLGESVLYGFLGGLFGCGLGLGILYVMKEVMAYNPWMEMSMDAELAFSLPQLLGAFFGGILLAVLSSLVPIWRTAKISIKDIILDLVDTRADEKVWKLAVGLLLTAGALIIPRLVSGDKVMIIGGVGLFLFPLGIVMLVPWLSEFFITGLEKIYPVLFGNEGLLAAKNLRKNKSIFNSIALLAVGIGSILMISILSHSVGIEVVDVYSKENYEIMFRSGRADRTTEQRLRAIPGVKSTYGHYEKSGVELANREEKIGLVRGIEADQFFNYKEPELMGDKDEILNRFSEGRTIILNKVLGQRFAVQVEDTIQLETERGSRDYRVVGFTNTLWRNGNMAYAPARYWKQDMNLNYFTQISIKTYQAAEPVKERIESRFSRENIWTNTVAELEARNRQSNRQLFILLQGFSVLALLIGIFGVFNNFMVNFLTRKRELAVFRSIGMDKWQLGKMVCLEALSGGVIGGVIGLLAGRLLMVILSMLLEALNMPIPLHYSLTIFGISFLGGILVSLVAILRPAFKAAGLNIVEEIKYE